MTAPPVAAAFGFDTIEVVVGRNDTLDRIFRRLRLSLADLATIRQLPAVRQALDLLRPGDQISVTHQNGELQGLTRQLNVTQRLEVKRADDGFAAQIIENPVEIAIARQRGVITSSLFEAADEAGISDQTALALANIFGWDVDFVLDIRDGDSFIVVYEQVWQDGKFVRDGDIIAAEFVNDQRTYRAVRYTLPDGHAEYFTPDGRSLRKTFLRAPVEFSRISSRFNPRRRHPILNTIRAHKGVDYAAPTGTPVRAAGDGRIRSRGRQGGYGNAVVIEHGGGISTLYGHLSRFAKGASPGQRVRQGQIVGYVGRTGLASGPHLHYEYRVNGVHRNPQTVKLGDARPIADELRADFTARSAPWVAELELINRGPLLADR
ncbi:MAG: peptidoglycan DD-metalloendopeptidase family protein [Gemmatimonadetes bacterium]|nr:peptidoglycan DD-metalloendopeptidase family protein [Gemmatimonadota bacterium]